MSSQNPESKQSADPRTLNDPDPKQPSEEAPGDEEEECGFCLFMKAGPCKQSFIAWENCIKVAKEQNEDSVERCYEEISNLMKCMDTHGDYYDLLLQAKKKAEEEAVKEFEKEKAAKNKEDKDSKELKNK